MVQSVSMQSKQNYGSIDKVGVTENGRIVYQVSDNNGKIAGRLSVAVQDSDTFEKSYQTIINSAPKLQAYAEKMTPEKAKKRKKQITWGIAIAGMLGSAIPIYLTRNLEGKRVVLKQALAALGGLFVGLGAGIFGIKKIMTPPGAKDFEAATNAISKLDVQPLK